MHKTKRNASLVRAVHKLTQGSARPILEQACRDWLDGRRRARAEALPWPKLPWPLDGRDVDFGGYCAALVIWHDAHCPRCEQRPLFPMPAASGDLSSEEAKQVTYDGVAWVLLRDAITANPDADMLRDAFEAVRAELRRRGVLSDPVAGLEGKASADADGGPESSSGFLGREDLADALGIHATRRDAFFQQLSRRRKSLGDDNWHEVRDPQSNSSRYLYRADSPKLRDLAAGYVTPKLA